MRPLVDIQAEMLELLCAQFAKHKPREVQVTLWKSSARILWRALPVSRTRRLTLTPIDFDGLETITADTASIESNNPEQAVRHLGKRIGPLWEAAFDHALKAEKVRQARRVRDLLAERLQDWRKG